MRWAAGRLDGVRELSTQVRLAFAQALGPAPGPAGVPSGVSSL